MPRLGPLPFCEARLEHTVPIGVLFSRSGPYETLGREGYLGATTAIREINAHDLYGIRLAAEIRDPAGNIEAYAPLCRDLVEGGVRFVVGCTTSWSRKEVIPVLEKTGAQLWYPCPYEGFEANDHLVYVGACPNQHILPLLDYVLPRYGREPLLVGSNYIWGWETSRIAREVVERAGGAIKGERFVPLGDTDIARIIDEIQRKQPDFVLNTLIGPSSRAFVEAYHDLGERDPRFSAAERPIISCNWTESEIAAMGRKAAGHLSVAPYFASLETSDNREFLATIGAMLPAPLRVSAFFVQAYAAVHMIARGIAATGERSPAALLAYAAETAYPAPFGPLRIHPATNHAILAPRIARARADGTFEVLSADETAIIPDPYLVSSLSRPPAVKHLRVVK
jgi:branched-chain amino acid transport system substrate-binding protein